MCTYTCIGVSVRALMCVLERGPNSYALALLQGAVMSSSHFSAVFSHQRESHRSSSLRGEVCVRSAKWEVFEVEFCLCLCLFKHISLKSSL